MIFVDTSFWFASVVPSDPDHAGASRWLTQNQIALITTDYVVDETLTLLRARGQPTRALWLGERFFDSTLAKIHHLSEADILLTWQVFRQFSDKEWSFTDCSSKVVIERLQIPQAAAFDHHFRQFGTLQVLP